MTFNVLDLCGCAGGATAGYQRAGATVTAVDLDAKALAQSPAEHRVTGDGLAYLREHGHRFDLVHMSWPCQRWAANGMRMEWPDLVTPSRALAEKIGIPYVMENVPRAPLINPSVLCGTMFNLTAVDDDGTLLYLQRHRSFEAPWAIWGLTPDSHHHPKGVQWAGAYGGARRDKREAREVRKGGAPPREAREPREPPAEMPAILVPQIRRQLVDRNGDDQLRRGARLGDGGGGKASGEEKSQFTHRHFL